MKIRIAAYASSTAMLVLVYGLGVAVSEASTEHKTNDVKVVDLVCPHEDSCTADYDGELDRWVVRVAR